MAVVNFSLFSKQPGEGKTKTMNLMFQSQEIQKSSVRFTASTAFLTVCVAEFECAAAHSLFLHERFVRLSDWAQQREIADDLLLSHELVFARIYNEGKS